jgi:hypothetical protein
MSTPWTQFQKDMEKAMDLSLKTRAGNLENAPQETAQQFADAFKNSGAPERIGDGKPHFTKR